MQEKENVLQASKNQNEINQTNVMCSRWKKSVMKQIHFMFFFQCCSMWCWWHFAQHIMRYTKMVGLPKQPSVMNTSIKYLMLEKTVTVVFSLRNCCVCPFFWSIRCQLRLLFLNDCWRAENICTVFCCYCQAKIHMNNRAWNPCTIFFSLRFHVRVSDEFN